MKIYAIVILVLSGGLCVDGLLNLKLGSNTQASASTSGGLLGGLLGGGSGGLLGGVLGGGTSGGLLNLKGLLSGLTSGGGLLGLDLSSVLKGLNLEDLLSTLDLKGVLTSLTNNTNLNLSSLLQGLTGKDGPLSIVTKLLQKILCLVKTLNLPLVKDILSTVSQTTLLGLENTCNAPGGSDLLSDLLPGLLSANGTLGGLGGLGGILDTVTCLLSNVVPSQVPVPLLSGLLQSGVGNLNCKNGSILNGLGLDGVLETVNNVLGGLLPLEKAGILLGALFKNLGIKADLLKGIVNIDALVNSVVCLAKKLKLESVVTLVKNVASSIELEILDNMCQTDQGLLDSLLLDLDNITQPLLKKIFCLVENKLGSVVTIAGVNGLDKFVGGLCANGSLAGLLQNFGPLIAPVAQILKDTIGLAGVKLDDIIQLLASLGVANIDEIKLFLVNIDCMLRAVSFDLIPVLVESLSDDAMIKMAPALCSLGKLDQIIIGLLTGDAWLQIQAYVYVNGQFDLELFKKLICLAKKFGIVDTLSLIKSAADITKFYTANCDNYTPTYSLFDEVKLKCVNGLSTDCQNALNTVVMKDNCAACTTGTGCNQLTGLLPADVVTECNAKCVACKNG